MLRVLKRCVVAVVAAALAAPAGAAAQESVAYQGDPAHTGAFSVPGLSPPFARRWVVDLGQPTSFPIIAGGRVHVMVRNPEQDGARVVTLDGRTGAPLWEWRAGGNTLRPGIAYGSGSVFVLDGSGLLTALDPASGAQRWATQLPDDSLFWSEPVVADGTVYAEGGEPALYAVDAVSGRLRWQRGMSGSGDSSPSVGDGRVHVGYDCDIYGFSLDGRELWNRSNPCTGGTARRTVLAGGRLYVRYGNGNPAEVLDPASGQVLANFAPDGSSPAIAGDDIFVLDDTRLHALDRVTLAHRWTHPQTGMSVTPIVVNDYVIAGSETGSVFALDRRTGAVRWRDELGRWIPDSRESAPGQPLAGLGAGEGMFVVPADGVLVAYESGGPGTGAPQPPQGPVGEGPALPPGSAAPHPRLSLRAARRDVWLGQRTRVRGRLTGTPVVARRRVVLELDDAPFGAFRVAARGRTTRSGRYSFWVRPARNVRVRVRVAGPAPRITSRAVTVFADFPYRSRTFGRGSARPRVRVTMYAFRRAALRRRTVHAYLARSSTAPYRLVARRRWQKRTRRSVTTTLPFPRGSLGKGQTWLLCLPERTPDAFGRPSEIERRCGEPTLPRGLS